MEAVYRNLLTRLVGLGLLDEAALVDGSVTLGSGRQRNRFYYLRRLEGPSYFMKEACGEGGADASLQLEAKIYQRADRHPDCASLRAVMPSLIRYDPDASMLITELLVDSENLSTVMRRSGRFDHSLLRELGRAAAGIHGSAPTPFVIDQSLLDGKPHWILRLDDEPSPLPSLRGRSEGSRALIDLLVDDPVVSQVLQRQRAAWRQTHLIHGDFKWENALRVKEPESAVRVIDWEQANLGDPAWDLGYGFAAIHLHAAITASEGLAEFASGQVTAAMQQFWLGYLQQRSREDEAAATLLRRAVDLMPTRFLIAAFELCYGDHRIPPISHQLIQQARHLWATGSEALVSAINTDSTGEPGWMH